MVLSVANVSKQYGIDIVLEQVSFRIDQREKVGLLGRNGTGKSTLLKIITQQEEPDSGFVNIGQGAKIGYLKQEEPVQPGRTVLEEAESALVHRKELESRLTELEKTIAENPTDEDLDEYSRLLEHFSEAEGYSAERDVKKVLEKMGFLPEDHNRLTETLSGGEKTRLALARILLEEPDLLILDEPTNHLDLQATEWLENWINAYHGAVLLVSHDRTFLQSTIKRVLEVRNHKVKDYPGNFNKYLRLRAEDEERQAEEAAKQAQEIAKLDEFVRRFINSQRTAQARGRQKMLNRLLENRIEAPTQDKGMVGGFKDIQRSGDIVIECQKLSVGFPDETLYENLEWFVRWQERWGVIGENGAGKSTLIKTVLGRHKPVSGSVRLGKNIDLAYFSQDTAILDPEDTPLSFIIDETDLKPGPARDLLGRFLFHGDDVFRPIKTLSGGEKNKLVLAALTHANPNLLVLDEPTNHLDMDSREALAAILNDYPGTLILISHDRWLLSQVTQQTLDIRRSGPIVYNGSYQEYRDYIQKPDQTTTKNSAPTKPATIPTNPNQPQLTPRELSKEIQRLKKVIEENEDSVTEQEQAIADIEATLASPPDGANIRELSEAHLQAQKQLEANLAEWELNCSRLAGLESLQGN